MIQVPNKFPRTPPSVTRLAVIGDAPGELEEQLKEPFVGSSGKLLKAITATAGLVNNQTFFGNICQIRPPYNDTDKLDWSASEIQDGLAQLSLDLQQFQPNCLLLLGPAAFRAFRPDLCYWDKRTFKIPLNDWRGSIIETTDTYTCKAVSTFHPSYILRAYRDIAYFKSDIARAGMQARFPGVKRKLRTGLLQPTRDEVLTYIKNIRDNHTPIGIDIEGYADGTGITMICLCPDETSGIVIPFWIGQHYWSKDDEVIIWQALAQLLADPNVRKTAHNCFYELFVLAWRHSCIVVNLYDDTMIKGWELQPELERSLAVNASIYTEEPYYKDDRESPDPTVKLGYNFKDGVVMNEINNVQHQYLIKRSASYEHYRFNMTAVYPVIYMMLRGCRYDLDAARQNEIELTAELQELQTKIDAALIEPALAAGVLTRKRKSDPWSFNVKSSQQKKWLLYVHLGFKPSARRGDTSDETALLNYWIKSQNEILRLVIQAVRKRTQLSDLHKLVPNDDGRMRTTYDLVNTDTGRSSSRSSQALRILYKADGTPYWEETGTNLQNVTKKFRTNFTTDTADFWFWQYDLSGADGWTVAADLAALGHPTMLEDYLYGIKPALVLQVMLIEQAAGRNPAAVNSWSRETLKKRCREVKKDLDVHAGQKDSQGRPYDWQYLCCKRVQHGSNYGAQNEKVAEVVFKDSDGQIVLSPKDAGLYQYYYKLRYNTDARNDWIRRELADKGYLQAACGIRRQFHGLRSTRIVDDETVRQAAAFEPQANTTFITNAALINMYYDPENRRSNNSLFVEPLLQIHDALAGQYLKTYHSWAHRKFQQWFNVPLNIHGIQITIPADGGFGPNWRETTQSYDLE